MANNRMYLVHRPTRLGIYLGKRMAIGWYGVPPVLAARLQSLFDQVEQADYDGSQDDFAVVLEDDDESPLACRDLTTTPGQDIDEDGVITFQRFTPKP